MTYTNEMKAEKYKIYFHIPRLDGDFHSESIINSISIIGLKNLNYAS